MLLLEFTDGFSTSDLNKLKEPEKTKKTDKSAGREEFGRKWRISAITIKLSCLVNNIKK